MTIILKKLSNEVTRMLTKLTFHFITFAILTFSTHAISTQVSQAQIEQFKKLPASQQQALAKKYGS